MTCMICSWRMKAAPCFDGSLTGEAARPTLIPGSPVVTLAEIDTHI
jgi:hypothetical protein